MDMRVFLSSIDRLYKCSGEQSGPVVPALILEGGQQRLLTADEACRLYGEAMAVFADGNGEIREMRRFLRDRKNLRGLMMPGAYHFMAASELIWRACERLLSTEGQISECRSYYTKKYYPTAFPTSRRDGKSVDITNALRSVNRLILGDCLIGDLENQRRNAVANLASVSRGIFQPVVTVRRSFRQTACEFANEDTPPT
jgi:hypothetical protein